MENATAIDSVRDSLADLTGCALTLHVKATQRERTSESIFKKVGYREVTSGPGRVRRGTVQRLGATPEPTA